MGIHGKSLAPATCSMILIRGLPRMPNTSNCLISGSHHCKNILPFSLNSTSYIPSLIVLRLSFPPPALLNSFKSRLQVSPTKCPRQASLLLKDDSQEQLDPSGWRLDSGDPTERSDCREKNQNHQEESSN